MGRPPLPLGAHGSIKTTKVGDKRWEARTRVRVADGSMRRLRKVGATQTAAVHGLQAKLADLAADASAGEISGQSTFVKVAAAWMAEIEGEASAGDRSPNTARLYRGYLDNHLLPAFGNLRMRELTVSRCDALVKAKRQAISYTAAKSIRGVLSGVCGYAVRHGALASNPVRDVGRLVRGDDDKQVRALTADERADLLARLQRRQRAQDADLPDLVRFMLATGVRIGELLALTGDDISPDAREVTIEYHLIRVKGRGMVRRKNRKGNHTGLTLRLPEWAVPLARRRKLASGGPYPLFPSPSDGDSWRPVTSVAHVIRAEFDECGYEWVTSHVFRKTVATVLDEASLPTTAIADQLGNTPAVAERHYRARRSSNEAMASALEGMI